jgi:O-glycosyl hydrolase
LLAQTVTVDASVAGRRQVIDGFGTCLSGSEGEQEWWQQLYFDDLGASILRMDLTPTFKSPWSDNAYNSPSWGNAGPDGYYARAYTNASDYTRPFSGRSAQIAVMGPDIDANTNYFDFGADMPRVAGLLARLGATGCAPGGFKLIGSLWSPAPWVKLSSGNTVGQQPFPSGPAGNAPFPFIWLGNFAGGRLDVSGTPLTVFDDSSQGGAGPTSALTQFARCTAAYLRGFQRAYQVRFDAVCIQNELNFEEFYNSCTYPLSSQYIAALKAVRAELDQYPDLAPIKIMGPEDLLGGDIWGLWQYGAGSSTVHKNLQYLQNIAADPEAAAAEAFFCIHGYASDGVSAANATPTLWNWWANGWTTSPTPGIPPNIKGFTAYGRKSWMTETSGENTAWLSPDPASAYPSEGAWGVALRIHQALTAGQQSAWLYWQLSDGNGVSAYTLTDSSLGTNSPKYVAAKHFFKYIRPSSVRVAATVSGSTNLLASAYLHEANQTLTVVLLNTSPDPIQAMLTVPAQPARLGSFRSFTSSNNDLWQSSIIPITNEAVKATVPGYGITTLYGVAPPTLQVAQDNQGDVILSWSPASVGFKLQRATDLFAGDYQMDTNTVTVSGGVASVAEARSGSPAFYRLILP